MKLFSLGFAAALFLAAIPSARAEDMAEMNRETVKHHEMLAADEAMSSMEMSHDMPTGPHTMGHMKMSGVRSANPADQKRADEILAALKPAIEKYKDYHLAQQDGFKPFLPNVPQPIYHFTKGWNALKAEFTFNPTQPTSLLYKKKGDGYELIGVMYTAPKRWSEDKLDQRVPLSVARWHQHVNICLPQKRDAKTADWTKFGPNGSIETKPDCDAAGGIFKPTLFGWMLHVYPYETDEVKVWAH